MQILISVYSIFIMLINVLDHTKTINTSKETMPYTINDNKKFIKTTQNSDYSLSEDINDDKNILQTSKKYLILPIILNSSLSPPLNLYNSGSIKDHYTITDLIIGRGSYAIVKLGFSNTSAPIINSNNNGIFRNLINLSVRSSK